MSKATIWELVQNIVIQHVKGIYWELEVALGPTNPGLKKHCSIGNYPDCHKVRHVVSYI